VPLALDTEVGKAKRKRNENVSGFKKNTFGWMVQQQGHKTLFSVYQFWQ